MHYEILDVFIEVLFNTIANKILVIFLNTAENELNLLKAKSYGICTVQYSIYIQFIIVPMVYACIIIEL